MKLSLSLVLAVILLPAFTITAGAEGTSNAKETVEDLRTRLFDVQAKEAELQARARQLDEDLKPENIERSLAGIGSTKPEELREMRRRQLTIERERVSAQIKILASSRERLESAIRTADGVAYQQSAERTTPPVSQALIAQNAFSPRWLLPALAGFAIIGAVLVITLLRKRA